MSQFLDTIIKLPQVAQSRVVDALGRIWEEILLRTVGKPALFTKINALPLNNATDGTALYGFRVPDGVIYEITDIDTVYTATGSYRLRVLEATQVDPYDLIENTATDIHWSGHQVLESGTTFVIAQGATVSGTGNIDARIGGRIYKK